MTDVLVVGAGPAGVAAALRAADLGARTALVTSTEFGGMATVSSGPPFTWYTNWTTWLAIQLVNET